MKKQYFALLALLCSATLSMSAQGRHRGEGQPAGDRDGQRQEMVMRQASALVDRMSLDETTANWFVPLYKEYNDALMAVRKEAMPSKDKKIDELSDEDAEQMILDAFASEEKQLAVKRAYYERFKERLTMQQLVKVFAMQPGQRGQRGGQGGGQGGYDHRGGFGNHEGFGPPPGGFGPPPGGF